MNSIERKSSAPPHPSRSPSDAHGNIVSGADDEIVAQIDRFADIVLRRRDGGKLALQISRAAPEAPMAQLAAAIFHLSADRREGLAHARLHLRRASALFGLTDRERALGACLTEIACERPQEASACFLELARVAPNDLMSAYLGHLHFLNHGAFEQMLLHAETIVATNPYDPFALAMMAFACDQTGRFGQAEQLAAEAYLLDPSSAWTHHALAHILHSQRRVQEAASFLELVAPAWDDCGLSMRCHNAWHLMLLRLAQGEPSAALSCFDQRIAPQIADSVGAFVDAASLLCRLELAGTEVGDRWGPLAEVAALRLDDHVLPFIDLHYLLSFLGAGRFAEAQELRRRAERHAAATPGVAAVWRDAALPMMDGLIARALGHERSAREAFARAIPNLVSIGGSGAQRAVFHQIAATPPVWRMAA